MKKFPTTQVIAFSLLTIAVQANAYQAEVGGAFGSKELGPADQETLILGGEFYINSVDTRTGPLNEAAFLGKATSINAFYADTEIDNFEGTDGVMIGGRFVDQNSGIYAEATYNTGDLEGHSLTGGLYLDSQSAVGVSLIDNDGLADGFGIEYKNLISQNNGTYLGLEAGVSLLEDDTSFNENDWTQIDASANYYIDKITSVGLGVSLFTGDLDGEELTISANRFVTQKVSAGIALARESFDGRDSSNSFLVEGAVRF